MRPLSSRMNVAGSFPVHPQRGEFLQRGGGVMPQDMLQHVDDAAVPRQPHRGIHGLNVYFFKGGALIQQTERVAHAAFRQPRDEPRRVMAEGEMLPAGRYTQDSPRSAGRLCGKLCAAGTGESIVAGTF